MDYSNLITRLVIAEHIDQKRIHDAIFNKDAVALGQMIREDNSIVNARLDGHPLLVTAFFVGAEDIIVMLLHNGADPTITDNKGKSLLDYVVDSGQKMAHSLVHTLRRFGYPIEIEDETKTAIREKFDFEGFKIINAGLKEHQLKKVLTLISESCRKMRKFGFGNLLYGPLILTSKELHGLTYNEDAKQYINMTWGAYYSHAKDLVVCNVDNFNNQIFAHELAHRQWFKFMDATQRQIWTGKFDERRDTIDKSLLDYIWELVKKATPSKTDKMGFTFYGWDEFDYSKFNTMVQNKQEKYRLVDVLNTAATHGKPVDNEANMKTVRRNFVINDLLQNDAYGGPAWAAKKLEPMSSVIKGDLNLTHLDDQPGLRRIIENDETGGLKEYAFMKEVVRSIDTTPRALLYVAGKARQDPLSSTEYGKMNSSEDYAEAFGNFMANHPMPKELYEQFVRVNNLKLANKRNTKVCPAKNSRQNVQA